MIPVETSVETPDQKKVAVGARIANRYEVEALIAEGAFGAVWLAKDIERNLSVALKTLLRPSEAADVVARFRREARFLERIRSPHVAKVLEFLEDPVFGMILVLEYINGPSLADMLSEREFSVEEAIDIAIDILSGVRDLHASSIVHRDLKPANVIVRKEPSGRLRGVICDIGMGRQMRRKPAKDSEVTSITRADQTIGTLKYMAPEQILNSSQVTEQSDLYSVGAMLFRAVDGDHPYAACESPRDLAHAKLMQDAPALDTGRDDWVAQGFAQIVAKALSRRSSERYANASEMLQALEELREFAQSIDVSPTVRMKTILGMIGASPSTSPPPGRRSARSPALRGAAFSTVGLVVGTLGVGIAVGAGVMWWTMRSISSQGPGESQALSSESPRNPSSSAPQGASSVQRTKE